MSRLILASNRLPIKAAVRNEQPSITPSDGGLASAVGGYFDKSQGLWIGYLGQNPDIQILKKAKEDGYLAVQMDEKLYINYYHNFSNRVLWPLLHGFQARVEPRRYWHSYETANKIFAHCIYEHTKPEDIIWIHDYHLFLVPQMLRDYGIKNKIGFFLHTPFLQTHFFSKTHYGQQILRSLNSCDNVGVQTTTALTQLTEAFQDAVIATEADIDAYPIGIDFNSFSKKRQEDMAFFEQFPTHTKTKIILSLSRLDYTKGILHQLEAIAKVLLKDENKGKFIFQLIVVPSREDQPEYASLKNAIEASIEKINGTYGTSEWTPIDYIYGTLSKRELIATYRSADIMLVTPYADGMNLVAKEYLAANEYGSLILSRYAGAAEQLDEAILVDPANTKEIATALQEALDSPPSLERNRRLRKIIEKEDVYFWAGSFLRTLQR